MKTEDSKKLLAETYTTNNRDGQTWLVADNPYQADNGVIIANNYEWKKFKEQHPDILLTDYLPDGTEVRGDEIEVNEYICYEKNGILEQVATLKQKREVVKELDVKWQCLNPITKEWDDAGNITNLTGFKVRQVPNLKQKKELTRLEFEDGSYFSYDGDLLGMVNENGVLYNVLLPDQLQALKSWINKIEL